MDRKPRKTMVCVTVQRNCERLISKGAELADGAELRVVHVVKGDGAVLGEKSDGDALEYLFRVSHRYGAEMDMLRSDDVIKTLVDFAKENGITCIVIGSAPKRSKTDFAGLLMTRLPDANICIVP